MTPSTNPATPIAQGTTHSASKRAGSLLTDEMLHRFSKRMPKHDLENTFFADDFDELRDAGYFVAYLQSHPR